MESRGNFFANIEDEFIQASEEEIIKIMQHSWVRIWDALEEMEFDNQTIGLFLLYGAKVGVSSKNGQLNSKEMHLIDESFGKMGDNDMTYFYDAVSKRVREEDYNKLKGMAESLPQIAMLYLKFILSFAYIDKKVDDEDMKKLENAYGMILLTNFFINGDEEDSSSRHNMKPENKNTSSKNSRSKGNNYVNRLMEKIDFNVLTKKIFDFFESKNLLVTFDDIIEHFSEESEDRIKEELSKLCVAGHLYCADTVFGTIYWKG